MPIGMGVANPKFVKGGIKLKKAKHCKTKWGCLRVSINEKSQGCIMKVTRGLRSVYKCVSSASARVASSNIVY